MKKLVSVIIRTLNEGRYLEELLDAIKKQCTDRYDIEIVIVDSGSVDGTLDIAKRFGSRITYIKKEDFTFGRSLNYGCEFARGEFLVFISGHCIPRHKCWVSNLVRPLEGVCAFTYGRQLGRDSTKFSERQLFNKYFPSVSRIPQSGIFCNNANSAVRKDVWLKYGFNEELTGCEDMYLSKQLVKNGKKIGYVADAEVYHIHDETWDKVQIRYEREAIALQKIMPEIHVTVFDTVKYIGIGIVKDLMSAVRQRRMCREFYSIFRFRWAQYVGAYKGNHNHRQLSKEMKYKYFYPRVSDMDLGGSGEEKK